MKESRLKEWYQTALRAQFSGEVDRAASLYEQVLADELFQDEVDADTGDVLPSSAKVSVEGARLKFLTLKNLGDLQVNLGLKDSAMHNLLKAVDCDDTDLKVLVQLGKLAMEQGESSLARTVLGRALQLQPSYWPAIENFMINAYILGDWELCNSLIEGALKVDPNWIQGYILQRRCQSHITHADTSSTSSSSTYTHKDVSTAKRSRETVIETLASLPASITNIPLSTLKLLLHSIEADESIDTAAIDEYTMLRKTPSKLWSPGPSFGSPPLSSANHRRPSSVSALSSTHFSESVPLNPAAIGLPPTMLMGLQSRVDMHAQAISAAGMIDGRGSDMDMDVDEDFLSLDPQVESRVTSLCDWLASIDSLQTSTSNRVKWRPSNERGRFASASLNGPAIGVVEVQLDSANLSLEYLLAMLHEHVERLSDDTEEDLSTQSKVHFFCDRRSVSEDLKRCLSGRGSHHPSDTTLAILEQIASPEELRDELGWTDGSDEDQRSDTLSQMDRFSDRALITNENTQTMMDDEEDGDGTEDEEDTQSAGPPVSRSSSRIAASRTSTSLKPMPKRTASKAKLKGVNAAGDDEEGTEDEEEEEGDDNTEKSSQQDSVKGESSAKATSSATGKVTASAKIKAAAAAAAAVASTSKTSLSTDSLDTWLRKLFDAFDSAGSVKPFATQVLGPNFIPAESLPSFDSEGSLKESRARSLRHAESESGPGNEDLKPLPFTNEKLYVLRMVALHLQSLPLTQALYLVVYHIAHLWHSYSIGKRLAAPVQAALRLLRTMQPELELSPPLQSLLPLQTLLPTSEEHYDHLLLPHLSLYLAEVGIGGEVSPTGIFPVASLIGEISDSAPRILLDEPASDSEKHQTGGRRKRGASNTAKKVRFIDPADYTSSQLQEIELVDAHVDEDNDSVIQEANCYHRDAQTSAFLPSRSSGPLKLTQLTHNEWNYFVRLLWVQLSQLMDEFASQTMQIRPIWFGSPAKENEDSLTHANLSAMKYRVESLRALLNYRNKVINPLVPDSTSNSVTKSDAPSAVSSLASFTDSATKSHSDSVDVLNMPQFWSQVSGKALESVSNILSKLATLQVQRSSQREKKRYDLASRSQHEIGAFGGVLASGSAMDVSADLMSRGGSGPELIDLRALDTSEIPSNSSTYAAQVASNKSLSIESIEQEFNDESISPVACIQRRRFFPLLRRGCRFFTHESRTELALHAFAAFLGSLADVALWRSRLVDILENIVNAGVEAVENVNKVESSAVRAALGVCDRGREADLLAASEPTPPSEFVANLISCVLCMFTQFFRADNIVFIEPQPKNLAILQRQSVVAQLVHFLSLPIVRNFFHWSLIHEGQNLSPSQASSASSAAPVPGKRGVGRPRKSPASQSQQTTSSRLTESSASVVSDGSANTAHADSENGGSGAGGDASAPQFSVQLSLHFELAQVSIQSMLREFVPGILAEAPPATRKKAKAKYAWILTAYFWLLRSATVPKVVDTKLLLDYLWVAHLNLSQDDICYAGDGVLLVTSIRFVNELEDTMEALAKRFKRLPKTGSSASTLNDTPVSTSKNSRPRSASPATTSSLASDSSSRGDQSLVSLALQDAAFDGAPEVEAEAFSYSPLLKMESLEIHRVFGDEESEVTTSASKFVGQSNEELDDMKALIAEALIPEAGTSTLGGTSLPQWQISRMRHELLHRCTCCLYHVELPVPASLRLDFSAGKPHRQTRKSTHLTYFGLPTHDFANSLHPIVNPWDAAEAGSISTHSSEVAAQYSMESLWKHFGPHAANATTAISTSPSALALLASKANGPKKRGPKPKVLVAVPKKSSKILWAYGSDDVDYDREPEKFAQRFALYHLHAASGSLAIRSPPELAIEDGYHLFRYLEGLLLEKSNVKGANKMQELSSFIFPLFALGPYIAPKTVATYPKIAKLTDWLKKSSFDLDDDWSHIPTARNFVSDLNDGGSSAMNIDSSEHHPFAENDSFTKDLDFRACKRYSSVYDNIFYMRARSALHDGMNTAHTSALSQQLLLRQIYLRPHHVMALLELSQQAHWLLLYRMRTDSAISLAPRLSGGEDASEVDPKGLFFLTVRSVLLAAQVLTHYHTERDSNVELKGLKLAISGDQKGLSFISKISRAFPWMPMTCFEGEDASFWVNARKHLITVLWKGASWFEGTEAAIALLSQAKHLCVRWMDFDPTIASNSAGQSGLWIVSYLKGRVQEELTNVKFPMKLEWMRPLKRFSIPRPASPSPAKWSLATESPSNVDQPLRTPRDALTIDLDLINRIVPAQKRTGLERWNAEVSPFPSQPTKDNVQNWMMRRLTVGFEAMEDYDQALTSTPAQRSAAIDARYRLHKWRLELVLQLYDPDLSPLLSNEYIAKVKSTIELAPPSENATPMFSSTDLSAYFSVLPNSIFLQPVESMSPLVPQLTPLAAADFFEVSLSNSHGTWEELRELLLDSTLTGLRECLELKKATKHLKTFFLLSRLLSGVNGRELHQATQSTLNRALQSNYPRQLPTMANCDGRIVDRTAALELSSHLINFKALAPKMQFWTAFNDDVPDFLRQGRLAEMQSKHLEFVLELLARLLDDHIPHMWVTPPNYLASLTPPSSTTPAAAGDESGSEEPAPTSTTTSTTQKGPQPLQTRAARVSKAPEAPRSLLAPGLRAFLGISAYLDNIFERIAVDESPRPQIREECANRSIPLVRRLLLTLLRPAVPLSTVISTIPVPTFTTVIKAACSSYRLARDLDRPALLLLSTRSLLSAVFLFHSVSPTSLELTADQASEYHPEICDTLPLETALARLQPVLPLLRRETSLDIPDAIRQAPMAVLQGQTGAVNPGELTWTFSDTSQTKGLAVGNEAPSKRGPKSKKAAKATTSAPPVQANYAPPQQHVQMVPMHAPAQPEQMTLAQQHALLARPDLLQHLAAASGLTPAQYMMMSGFNPHMFSVAPQYVPAMPMMIPPGMMAFPQYLGQPGLPAMMPIAHPHAPHSLMDLTQDSDEE